jgi:hypothetical protein
MEMAARRAYSRFFSSISSEVAGDHSEISRTLDRKDKSSVAPAKSSARALPFALHCDYKVRQ